TGIITERQTVLDELLMALRVVGRGACPSTAHHETAVGHGAVLAFELLGADEMHRGLIRLKVMRHRDDVSADLIGIGAFGEHDITFAGVLLAGYKAGAGSAAGRGDRTVDRQ